MIKPRKNIYLDYASGAPVSNGVLKSYFKNTTKFSGNPSSIHKDGVLAKKAMEDARGSVASVFGVHKDEVIFTGGGTESNNLAILGVCRFAKKLPEFSDKKLRVITTRIEHPSIINVCNELEKEGFEIFYVPIDEKGNMDLKIFKEALTLETVIVAISYANNEIGVIFPVKEIAKEIRRFKKNSSGKNPESVVYPVFHLDACQAVNYLDVFLPGLGVDIFSFNGTKIGALKGIGSLIVKRGVQMDSIMFGGGQEGGIRSGTENVPAIVSFALALEEARKFAEGEFSRLTVLRDFCISEMKKNFPDSRINGNSENRLPNNINVSFQDIESELLVLELDAKNISVSAGSACGSAKGESSYVINELYGENAEKKYGTIRISMGRETKKKDIVMLITALKNIFIKYKSLI